MDMQAWVKEQPAINELADYYALMMLTETKTSTATVVTAPVAIPTPDLLDIIKFVYWIGILLLSARFMIQLSSIFRLVLKSKSINVDQISIRSLSEPANPFSFWQWIFIYLPGLKEDEKQEILTHEQTHVRQWHSIDVIISEIVNIICWMNPFAWLLKPEIRLNLEYLADHKVMESGTNKKAYQYHLLGLANQNRQTGLYNNFNLSHLKNRIKMMNKRRTSEIGKAKYLLFAPLAGVLLMVSNIESVAREIGEQIPVVAEVQQKTEQALNTDVAVANPMAKDAVETMNPSETAEMKAAEAAELAKAEAELKAEAKTSDATAPADTTKSVVYDIPETMPFFPGGQLMLMKYLADNIKYPASAVKAKKQGRVIVTFIVQKDGSVTHAKIAKSIDPELDAEALRVVKGMPKWTPGTQNGKPVSVRYMVPVKFSLWKDATPGKKK